MTTDLLTFGQRLERAVQSSGPIVAGIDPHRGILEAWALPDTAAGARVLSRRMLEACEGRVAMIKPQSAFFERFGSAGIAVLEELVGEARERGVLCLLDAKRGDIGSTMGAYAEAYLRPGAPLEVDAVTVSPFLGYGSLEPCLEYTRTAAKGVYVLCLTSNPDGAEVQHARDAHGRSIAATMAAHAAADNASAAEAGQWGSVGLVVGATIGDAAERTGVDLAGFSGTFLAPGFGAQGARPADLPRVFGAASARVLPALSRSILQAGPSDAALERTLEALAHEYALAAEGAAGY